MSRARRLRRISRFVAALVVLCARTAGATGFIDPALHFRMLATAHFVIYFHEGEEPSARRLAAIAEDTWRALEVPLGVEPPALTHVILADQTEAANGWAIPIPYDTIFITAAWPSGADTIGLTDDWLRLAFTHEFTHIVHLDRSEGWARAVRRIFGRAPVAFPNLLLPLWEIEGLAVYEESAVTGEGRLHAGDFRALEETARRAQALDPLDRVNGGLVRWPDGSAPYVYGGPFTEFLAEEYGAEKLATLADNTARRLPYTSSLAFKSVYGKSLGQLWKEFESRPAQPAASVDADRATRVTHTGFSVTGPRFIPGACAGCLPDILYGLDTPDAFPSLNRIWADGTHDRQLTRRYLGSTASAHGTVVVFDQDEIHRNAGLYSDLYALDLQTGDVRTLTSGTRLQQPDVSPDGSRIAAVRDADGDRDLVVLPFSDARITGRDAVTILAHGDATEFDAPRWSPDGRSIAAARHVLGGQSEIVVVELSSGAMHVIASDAHTRFVTPAWRPDGNAIVAAVAAEGEAFNLFEFPLTGGSGPRQLTHAASGATWPDVSADGRHIAYVGYTKDGYDVFTMPYPDRSSAQDLEDRGGVGRTFEPGGHKSTPAEVAALPAPLLPARYSPWPTLKPTSWTPYFDSEPDQFRAGAAVYGQDVLGYHAYSLAATWLVRAQNGADADGRGIPDWSATYLYARWRPTFFATAGQQTAFFAGPPTEDGSPTDVTSHETEFQAGVELPFIGSRRSEVVLTSILRASDTYNFPEGRLAVDRTALRAGGEVNTAHVYGRSISSEGGVTAGATIEAVRKGLGSYADATMLTADARAFLPGVAAHHVLAVRAGGGATQGDDIVGRAFLAGGAGPEPSPLSFDSRAFGLLRGFPADTFAGSHIAAASVEYRLPLAWPERGHGTLPVFLSSLSGSLFFDAANTWVRTFSVGNTKTSFGAELSAGVVAGYVLPFTLTAGVGRGHDGAGRIADATTVFVRVGRAF